MNLCSKRFGCMLLLSIAAVVAFTSSSADAANTVLKLETTLGDVHIRMLDTDAPGTVANFMNYVNQGDYHDSFFHRMIPGFVLQGGGFTQIDGVGGVVSKGAPTLNEFGRSNLRRTLAMAKVGPNLDDPNDDQNPNTGPDSATNQFFFNLGNNSTNLDNQNGGFTVFAYVVGDGMEAIDLLSGGLGDPYSVDGYNVQGYWDDPPGENIYWDSALGEVPLLSYQGGLYFEMLLTITVVGVDGDVDFDGDVDGDDYSGFLASFGQTGIGLAADFDGDYDVDLADFAVLRDNYTGSGSSPLPEPGAAAPEPTSMCLLGLGAMAILRRRRGKA
jgi:peptidyl-prolyl cis-trans isomerase A (cyclophilin A)